MDKKINIIGAGMGDLSYLTIKAKTLLEEADFIICSARLAKTIQSWKSEDHKSEIQIEYLPEKIIEQIQRTNKEKIVIAMSGDSGFYSGTKKLLDACKKAGILVQIEPGNSSLSYFASRLGLSWDDAAIISLHGNTANLAAVLRKHNKVFVLTQGQIKELCEELTAAGFGSVKLYIGRRLSYPDEEILETTPEKYQEEKTESLTVLFLIQEKTKRYRNSGIPDNAFVRGKVPMTKSEIRSIILSKLAIKENDIIYDIGAGTGSVSIELAIAATYGKVYAIEYKEEALALIKENKKQFACRNLEIISGKAPEALEGLPEADVVFIGGTNGRLISILKQILHPGYSTRIVISAITTETLSETISNFAALGIQLEDACQASITKLEKTGNYHIMKAQNPVFILTGQYNG